MAIAAVLLAGCASTTGRPVDNLVASVVKAPIAPDGHVAGRPTDLVVHFAIASDPAAPGRSLRAGRIVRITLPREFTDTATLPLLDYASDPRRGPHKLECNAAALLQGRPQSPVPFKSYALSRAEG